MDNRERRPRIAVGSSVHVEMGPIERGRWLAFSAVGCSERAVGQLRTQVILRGYSAATFDETATALDGMRRRAA